MSAALRQERLTRPFKKSVIMSQIDQPNPTMTGYLNRMDNKMKEAHGGVTPLTEWLPQPRSYLPELGSDPKATGAAADPYKCPTMDTETRYDRDYCCGYTVRWSPRRGVFYVYQNGVFLKCYLTNY